MFNISAVMSHKLSLMEEEKGYIRSDTTSCGIFHQGAKSSFTAVMIIKSQIGMQYTYERK